MLLLLVLPPFNHGSETSSLAMPADSSIGWEVESSEVWFWRPSWSRKHWVMEGGEMSYMPYISIVLWDDCIVICLLNIWLMFFSGKCRWPVKFQVSKGFFELVPKDTETWQKYEICEVLLLMPSLCRKDRQTKLHVLLAPQIQNGTQTWCDDFPKIINASSNTFNLRFHL